MQKTLDQILIKLQKLDKLELDISVINDGVKKISKMESAVNYNTDKIDKMELDISAIKNSVKKIDYRLVIINDAVAKTMEDIVEIKGKVYKNDVAVKVT
jgi:hypothetical protein